MIASILHLTQKQRSMNVHQTSATGVPVSFQRNRFEFYRTFPRIHRGFLRMILDEHFCQVNLIRTLSHIDDSQLCRFPTVVTCNVINARAFTHEEGSRKNSNLVHDSPPRRFPVRHPKVAIKVSRPVAEIPLGVLQSAHGQETR